MQDLYKGLFKIIKTALLDIPVTIEGSPDYKELFKVSVKHQIIPLVFNGLYKCYGNIEELNSFRTYTYSLLCHDQKQLHIIDLIEQAFQKNNIDYMLLKGASIKQYYPSSEYRLMSDIDILIKEEQYERIRNTLTEIGLLEGAESDHELIWHSKFGVVIELHKRVIPSYNDDYYAYYSEPWKKALMVKTNRFSMSPEDEYIYIFTHLTKHYRDGGIGLRHIIDIYLFKVKNATLDMCYIERELRSLELDEFHKNILHAIDVWFNDKEETEISEHITERIIESGSFGLTEKRYAAKAARLAANTHSASKAKNKAIFSLIFMPYSSMKQKYPFLQKAPILLPIMWVVRWLDAIINKRENIKHQSERVSKIDTQIVDSYNRELNLVGLKFKSNIST